MIVETLRQALSLADQVELEDRRRRRKEEIREEDEGLFLASRKIINIQTGISACTHFVYMVKRRYLPPRRRSERLHKQRCKITRPFEDGGSPARQAAADVATCKIVSRSNSNACRCTRESISPHSSLARSISSIHHSPPSLRPSTGG